MPMTYPQNVPSTYGRRKLSETRTRWSGALGQAVREMTQAFMPGVPPEAIMGFASNGSGDERTSLDERGYFGTEGPRWNSLRVRSEVRGLLGREAVADPAWMASRGGTRDQVATGLVNLRDHYNEVVRRLDARLRPASLGSEWSVALMFAGWSTGDSRAATFVNRYASDLAAVPEPDRWQAFLRAVARGVQAGTETPGTSHTRAVYTAVRTMQKLAVGRALAADHGGNVAWFSMTPSDVEDVIARASGGATTLATILGGDEDDGGEHGVPSGLMALPLTTVAAGTFSVMALALLIVYLVWRWRRGR